jgi:HD-GYP domain-containing protein (c-di-GMP phosphodiesterase class II)
MPKLELLMPGSIRVGDILATDIFTSNGVLLMLAGNRVTKENEYRLLAQDIYVCPTLLSNVPNDTPEPRSEPEPELSPQNVTSFQESEKVQPTEEHLMEEEEREEPVHALADSLYRDMMAVYAEIYCHGLSQTHERLIVEKVIYQAVGELLTKGRWFFDFNALLMADNYTQIHSVNVALISALIGQELGYKSALLSELILAAFIHDLGRKQIPLMIMNKPGLLTTQEFEYVKKHVNSERINLSNKIPDSVKEVIQQHHERWDGSGYPKGLTQNAIHPFAQIVAVADVFHALISDRPQRKALSLNDAFEWIRSGAGTQFNPEVVKLFDKVITLYPTGAMVMLNTGETGRVIKSPKGYSNRPQVRLVFDSRGQYIRDYIIKDLQECHTLFIKNVVYPKV